MPWEPPTIISFRTRFPEFEETDEGALEGALSEAIAEVGDTWIEEDRTPAVLYLAAHLLAEEGYGGHNVLPIDPTTGAQIKSRKVGDVTTEFTGGGTTSASGGSSTEEMYGATFYGRRFLRLRKRSFPAVLVV